MPVCPVPHRLLFLAPILPVLAGPFPVSAHTGAVAMHSDGSSGSSEK